MLYSTYITNKSLTPNNYYNKNVNNYSKLDQFMSSLCSIRKIELDAIDFYIDFDDEYVNKRKIVEKYISSNFASSRCRIFSFRLEKFEQWRHASLNIPNAAKLVILMTNHDHVFVPKQNLEFLEFMKFVESREEEAIGIITHWPEFITKLGSKKYKSLNTSGPIFTIERGWIEGTSLINTNFFKSWWNKDFTGNRKIVRPDNPFGPSVNFSWTKQYIPPIEFFRHLDGYGHVGVTTKQASALKPCCKLVGNSILHDDWVRGFTTNKQADLPDERPKSLKYRLNGKNENIDDYLANANSYLFSITRTLQLLKNLNLISIVKVLCKIGILVIDKSLTKALIRNYMFPRNIILRIKYLLFRIPVLKIKIRILKRKELTDVKLKEILKLKKI